MILNFNEGIEHFFEHNFFPEMHYTIHTKYIFTSVMTYEIKKSNPGKVILSI